MSNIRGFTVTLVTFLNILGASVGFTSAAFFAVGAATMGPNDIYSTVVVRHDINRHWFESASKQRAEYIVGATLLVLAFILQLAANFVPAQLSPSPLQSSSCAAYICGSMVALILLVSLLVRRSLSNSCSQQVRDMWEQEITARQQQSNHG